MSFCSNLLRTHKVIKYSSHYWREDTYLQSLNEFLYDHFLTYDALASVVLVKLEMRRLRE